MDVSLDAAYTSRHAPPISTTFVGALVRTLDLIIVGGFGLAVYFVHITIAGYEFDTQYSAVIMIALVIAAAAFQWCGAYSGDYLFSRLLRTDRLLSGWALTCFLLLALAFALKISDNYSRVWAVSWMVLTLPALGLTRMLISLWISRLAQQGRFGSRTIIVGVGPNGQRLIDRLLDQGDARTQIIGFIDDRADRVPSSSHGYPVLGDSKQLTQMIRRNLVDQVFIALPWSAEERVRQLVHRLAMTPVHIRLAPDFAGFAFADRAFTNVAGLPMLHLFDRPISGMSYFIKAVEDRVIAATALLLLAPALLAIAALIKLDSPGPVLFRQKRYGFNNNLVEVLKFRTMYVEQTDQNCETQTTRDDPRITRIGKFLRQSSLDEVPQLINVLVGDMSIVGPRPHAVATKADGRLFEEVVDRYAARHRVKPGITGWAQVNGWRGETNTVEKIQKRVEYDLYYIDNWSVWLDLFIVFRTLFVMRDDNAF